MTVPSRFEATDERKVLGRELEKLTSQRLFPVHRLDQEVSGLVLFATNAETQRIANGWFEKRKVHKTYQALSESERSFSHWPKDLPRAEAEIPENTSQEWRCRLLRGKRRSYEHEKGDPSVTVAGNLGLDDRGRRKWRLSPLTGRSHQLRFEMSRHGFPILGDALYGSSVSWEAGIALRAVELDLSAIDPGERRGLPDVLRVQGLFV